MSSPRRWRRVIIGIAMAGVLVGGRLALEPHPAPPVTIALTAAARAQVSASLASAALDRQTLLSELAATRVVLVGESHFVEEPITWLCELLGQLRSADGRSTILVLELPARGGPSIDRFLATGDEEALRDAFGWGALPYQRILRWVRAHPDAVTKVVAADESPWHTGLMRMLLTDTRNDTMARAVASAAQSSGSRVIVYGGTLHMMKSGRYLYDSDTRRPIGARLPRLGIGSGDVAAVWLYAGGPPADGAWQLPGAVSMAGPAGRIPINQIEESRIFGATFIGDIIDYAVYLGPATRMAAR